MKKSYTVTTFLLAVLSLTQVFSDEVEASSDSSLITTYPRLNNGDFVVQYDAARRIPKFVYETISLENISGELDRNNTSSHFSVDDRLAPIHQAESDDYKYSGFDRGHMAPAGNFKTDLSNRESTFLMTNIAPQNPSLNRYYWKGVEDKVRDLLATAQKVHIITGPLFLPKQAEDGKWYVNYQVIGENPADEPVAVPTHFFKVIIAEHDSFCQPYAVIVPNEKIDKEVAYAEFAVSLSKVEKAAGLVISEFLKDQLHVSKELVVGLAG